MFYSDRQTEKIIKVEKSGRAFNRSNLPEAINQYSAS